jgi:hypothetical protein
LKSGRMSIASAGNWHTIPHSSSPQLNEYTTCDILSLV